ncbi:hypothetical protein ACET3Z_018083 [Daucus carota]
MGLAQVQIGSLYLSEIGERQMPTTVKAPQIQSWFVWQCGKDFSRSMVKLLSATLSWLFTVVSELEVGQSTYLLQNQVVIIGANVDHQHQERTAIDINLVWLLLHLLIRDLICDYVVCCEEKGCGHLGMQRLWQIQSMRCLYLKGHQYFLQVRAAESSRTLVQ